MKLFSVVKAVFGCRNLRISDRMSTTEASFSIAIQNLPNMAKIQEICDCIPCRDKFSISFKNESDDILTISNKTPLPCDFLNLTDGQLPDEIVEVSIRIDKTVESNRFSIYDFDEFSKHLQSRSLTDVLSWIASCMSSISHIIFEVFDSDISFATGTMAFVSRENSEFSPKINRQERIQLCRDISSFYNMESYEVTPDEFMIEGIYQADNCFRILFGKLATILSIAYATPSASIENNMLNIRVENLKVAPYSIELAEISENREWLSIYNWIFTGGNPTDKALIAHNAMILHCKYADLFGVDEKLYGSIESNYNLYLKENVDRYLGLKRELSDYIQNVISQVGEHTTSILVQFKKNLIAIFGFIFTIVLTGLGRSQGWENIFSQDAIYIIQIVLVGSLIYLVTCIFETNFRLKKTKETYATLKKNYIDVLSSTDITQAFRNDELLKNAVKTVKRGMVGWAIAWSVLLIFIVLIIEFKTSYGGIFTWLFQQLC